MANQTQDTRTDDSLNQGRALWKKATDMYRLKKEEKRIHPDPKPKSKKELIAEAVNELDVFLKSEEGRDALNFLRASGNFIDIYNHEPEEDPERTYITLGLFKEGFHLSIGGLGGVCRVPNPEEVLEIWVHKAMHKPEELMPFIRCDLTNSGAEDCCETDRGAF